MEKEQIIEKWLTVISDDYMHYDEAGKEIARQYARACDIKEYGDKGVIMWKTFVDIDAQPKTSVLLFYIKPEYRGGILFLTMIKNLETIAISDGAKEIIIGASISKYKEDKFNKIFSHFGYNQAGFIKKV